MQKAFEESRYRMREKLKKEKEQEKKTVKRTQFILGGLLIICVILVAVSGSMQHKAINKCIKKGHSYSYCVEHS